MNDRGVPTTIAQAIRSRFDIVCIAPMKPGMSGAAVFRCEGRDGKRYALKRWPNATPQARIEEVHRVVMFCRDAGCQALPRIYPIVRNETHASADGFWELADWIPGQTLSADATLGFVESGAAAIASFQSAAKGLGDIHQPAPAVLDRMNRVTELDRILPSALRVEPKNRVSPQLADVVRNAQVVLHQNWSAAADKISRSMNQYADHPVSTRYVLRDVHRAHILFDDGQVSGLIDFDAIRRDTPAIDLARWAGSLLVGRADTDLLWESVLAGFRRGSPSDQGEAVQQQTARDLIQMAKHLHFATTWISLANWVVWLIVECRHFPGGEDAVVERILEWTQLSGQET